VAETSSSEDESEDDKASKNGDDRPETMPAEGETAEKSGSGEDSEATPSECGSGSEDIGEDDTEGEMQSGSEEDVEESDPDTGKSLLSNVIRKYELLSHHMEMGMLMNAPLKVRKLRIYCELPAGNMRKPKKKRKSNVELEYDLDDDFIDDTELLKQNEELQQLKLRTKHTGFFAAGGQSLELDT
jgi:HPC2 and ubinuclein domain